MASIAEEIDEKIEWNLKCLIFYVNAMRTLGAFKEYEEGDLVELIDRVINAFEECSTSINSMGTPLPEPIPAEHNLPQKEFITRRICGHAAVLECLFEISMVGGYPINSHINDVCIIDRINEYMHWGPYDDAKPVASGSVDEMGAQAHTGAACVDHGHGAELQQ